MKIYNYSFLSSGNYSSSVLKSYIDVERIRNLSENNKTTYPKVFEKLQEIALSQSARYSNEINGLKMKDSQINDLIITETTKCKEEFEFFGYFKTLKDIYNNSKKLQFSTYNIRDFHYSFFISSDITSGGTYKQDDNLLIEVLPDGTKSVVSETLSYQDTSEALEELIKAYKIADDDENIPKLLLIPCVILDFLLIAPFDIGNESISRLLTSLLLNKNDYEVGRYVSIEKQISRNMSEYYKAIRKSSMKWEDNDNDYNPFVKYFLDSTYSTYNELNSRFKIVDGEKKTKKVRIEETIKKSPEPISRKEIHLVWPDISQETIKKVIKTLLNENKIKKIGNYKDARYKRNWYGDNSNNDENIVIF